MFDTQYYVVYRRNQLVRGPLDKKTAQDFAEDLDMALMDPGYEAVNAYQYRMIQNGPTFIERILIRLHIHEEPKQAGLRKAA